jgi:hypothetical protein
MLWLGYFLQKRVWGLPGMQLLAEAYEVSALPPPDSIESGSEKMEM